MLRFAAIALCVLIVTPIARPAGIDGKVYYLGVALNQITSLPYEIWTMPSLVTLIVAHTGTRQLPPEASSIPNLVR